MRVVVCGSGDAFGAAGRGHAAYWVEGFARQPFMVDFGGTALAALKRFELDPQQLAGVAITHLHGDHIGGLPYLLADAVVREPRSAELSVLGPPGVASRLDALYDLFYGSLASRRDYPEVRTELEVGQSRAWLGVIVRAFAGEHMHPPDQALVLRFEREDGRALVFSGDTTMTPGLLEACQGAELVIAECSALAPPAGRHCTWAEWREQIPTLGAELLRLTHLGDEVRAASATLLAELPPGYDVAFLDDGDVIELG